MPYKNGYNVLPKLQDISGPIFEKEKDIFIEAKKQEVKKRRCYYEYNISNIQLATICNYISTATGLTGTFEDLAMKLREDIVIHCIDENTDWFAAGHVCFPSGWRPEEKIGKSFYEIHKDVPKMRLGSSRKIVEAMINSSPYERYVWTICFDKQISGHPDYPKKQFDIKNPSLFVKYERQCIIGFPEVNAALFTICQHFIEEKDLDKKILLQSLSEMSIEHIEYKNLQYSYSDVISYLKESL